MKIGHVSDFRRQAQMFLAGLKLASLVKAGARPEVAVHEVIGGTGNNRSDWGNYQTNWKGRRTQAQESARYLRQHLKAGHLWSKGYNIWVKVAGWNTLSPCESGLFPHPHKAKAAPGTPQPLARTMYDKLAGFVYYSDGSIASEADVLNDGYANALRVHSGTPKPPRVSKGAKARAARRYHQDPRTGVVTQIADSAR